MQFCIGFPAPSFSTPEIFTAAISTPQKSPPEYAGCHNTANQNL
ncbi:hypothetical protein L342_0590 [Escherichia coli CE516]|nr:hypothetical protein L342_0590 [Escherichia coli CE516]